MYTVKIKAVRGSDKVPPTIRFDIHRLLKGKLSEIGMKYGGTWPFLGYNNFLTVSGFRKRTGEKITEYHDWVKVVKAINETLDELEIDAHVRNEQQDIRLPGRR